jgi:RNA polymerase sigma-70 factor (ECF subfamily)
MEDDEFERHRPLLMGIAYRMLGSSAEAEDAVQDAWLRLGSADPAAIVDARAWLSTTIMRICIDRLKSARARRETYPGTWLPEPVLTTTPLDFESIQLGFLVLLERLDPKERAVFLLHKVFDYTHAEIAETLDISEAASRQLLHRASEHVAANRPRFKASRETHQRLLSAFMAAASQGDVAALAGSRRRSATPAPPHWRGIARRSGGSARMAAAVRGSARPGRRPGRRRGRRGSAPRWA